MKKSVLTQKQRDRMQLKQSQYHAEAGFDKGRVISQVGKQFLVQFKDQACLCYVRRNTPAVVSGDWVLVKRTYLDGQSQTGIIYNYVARKSLLSRKDTFGYCQSISSQC